MNMIQTRVKIEHLTAIILRNFPSHITDLDVISTNDMFSVCSVAVFTLQRNIIVRQYPVKVNMAILRVLVFVLLTIFSIVNSFRDKNFEALEDEVRKLREIVDTFKVTISIQKSYISPLAYSTV